MVIDDKYLNVLMVGMTNMRRTINKDHPLYPQLMEMMNILNDECTRINPPDLNKVNAVLQRKGWGQVAMKEDGKVDTTNLTLPQPYANLLLNGG